MIKHSDIIILPMSPTAKYVKDRPQTDFFCIEGIAHNFPDFASYSERNPSPLEWPEKSAHISMCVFENKFEAVHAFAGVAEAHAFALSGVEILFKTLVQVHQNSLTMFSSVPEEFHSIHPICEKAGFVFASIVHTMKKKHGFASVDFRIVTNLGKDVYYEE